jgi:2,4-dienoyl-CoA reductase-like NADH-dependent reductase (Old Yellow Enzyme family)
MLQIFQPFRIKDITLKNRLGMSPMCQFSAQDGLANDWHLVHYGTRGVGGIALIIFEATGVSPVGRISPEDLGLWKDEQIEPLKKIVDFIHQQDSKAGIQIAHAGRKGSRSSPFKGEKQLTNKEGGWQTIAPSAIPFRPEEIPPHELTKSEIKKVVNQFKDAALRAFQAGFDVLEIHAAHGYLIHEFLSPISNFRKDEYGGSFKGRIRLLQEIVSAVQTVWPERLPLFVRLSATDWTDQGWRLEDTVELAKILYLEGVDLIDCSSGGILPNVHIPLAPCYQVPFSEQIRKTGILTAAVGLITKPEEIQDILRTEKADIVLLGRELLRNPYFALHCARHVKENSKWPQQYLRAKLE